MKRLFLITITLISLFVLGRTSALADEIPAPSIVGDYISNFGGLHQIGNTQWSTGSPENPSLIFTYTSVDNDEKVIIAQNTQNSPDLTGKFSQFNWTYDDKNHLLWYCQQVFNADTAEEAAAEHPADPSDPCKGGCGLSEPTFSWSQLIVDPYQ